MYCIKSRAGSGHDLVFEDICEQTIAQLQQLRQPPRALSFRRNPVSIPLRVPLQFLPVKEWIIVMGNYCVGRDF